MTLSAQLCAIFHTFFGTSQHNFGDIFELLSHTFQCTFTMDHFGAISSTCSEVAQTLGDESLAAMIVGSHDDHNSRNSCNDCNSHNSCNDCG
jgi:hypothetical protein